MKKRIIACLSCRKIAEDYYQKTGNKTNRTTVNNIIRNKLGFHYLKTCIKNNKINNKENLLIQFAFIKIIVGCISKGFKIIFCDETGIMNKNNNYHCFRKPDEVIYNNIENNGRLNLIMSIDENQIIYYEINKESTTQNIFLQYMKNLKQYLDKKNYDKYVILLDNLSSHKTKELMDFYTENKINIIFNAPYKSEWNTIELCFRNLKKYLYSKLFISIEELNNNVKEFLENKISEKTLYYNYGETLREYRKFIEKYKNYNLNNIL